MKDGVNATPLPTVNTTGYIDHAAFLGTINPDTNKIPKHLFQGYLNIYNNYFKAPWMTDHPFFFQAEDGIRDLTVTGVQTCALPIFWISTSGSSSPISWPSVTSQRAISPSVNPSPRSGSLNS